MQSSARETLDHTLRTVPASHTSAGIPARPEGAGAQRAISDKAHGALGTFLCEICFRSLDGMQHGQDTLFLQHQVIDLVRIVGQETAGRRQQAPELILH